MILATPLTWAAGHRLVPRSLPPPPRFSPEPLTAIPSAAQNGADDILHGRSHITRVDSELLDLLSSLEDAAPAARWAAVVAESRRIRRWADAPNHAEELGDLDAALGQPHFVDPCLSMESRCRAIGLIEFSRYMSAANYDAALRGDWTSALRRAAALLRASNALLLSARTMLLNSVAAVFAMLATDHLRVLVAGLRARETSAEDPAHEDIERALTDARRALETPLYPQRNVRRAVIAAGTWLRETLAVALAEPISSSAEGGLLGSVLTDRAATIRTADARFVEVLAWVDAPDHANRPAPAAPPRHSGATWWLWNPGGKLVLDLVEPPLAEEVRALEEHLAEFIATRDKLRRELATH